MKLLIFFLTLASTAVAQRPYKDFQKVQTQSLPREVFEKPLLNTPVVVKEVQEDDLQVYLKGRQIVSQTIDEYGHTVVVYDDGLTKKVNDGDVVEVITPDGVAHKRKIMKMYTYSSKIFPPTDYSSRVIEAWLKDFSQAQLDFIVENFKVAKTTFVANETATVTSVLIMPEPSPAVNQARAANNYLYERIQYRSRFIALMLEANLPKK